MTTNDERAARELAALQEDFNRRGITILELVDALKKLVWASPHHWRGTAEYGEAWQEARALLNKIDKRKP